jgi:His-Xaa-Ser system protein HxsD
MENKKVSFNVNCSIYSKTIVVAAIYKYTDSFYITINEESNGTIIAAFELKEDLPIDIELVKKQFYNELIDQQIRYNVNQQFGHIRDLIVEQAFKPIS